MSTLDFTMIHVSSAIQAGLLAPVHRAPTLPGTPVVCRTLSVTVAGPPGTHTPFPILPPSGTPDCTITFIVPRPPSVRKSNSGQK